MTAKPRRMSGYGLSLPEANLIPTRHQRSQTTAGALVVGAESEVSMHGTGNLLTVGLQRGDIPKRSCHDILVTEHCFMSKPLTEAGAGFGDPVRDWTGDGPS